MTQQFFEAASRRIQQTVQHSMNVGRSLYGRRREGAPFQSAPLALLIDGENVSAEYAVALLAQAGTCGGVTIRRVYGNWAHPTMHRWQEIASHYGLTTLHAPYLTAGKNATDIKLVVEAMELSQQGIRRFCLKVECLRIRLEKVSMDSNVHRRA